jgi:hypothetical protein
MTLRVTRQFGEVLGTGDGKARVARQYLEVLAAPATSTIYDRSATSTLTLTQSANASPKKRSASSSLSLGQVASVELVNPAAESTLVLTQSATVAVSFAVSSESTLDLQQLAVYVGPKWVYAANAIFLQQEAYQPQVYEVSASSTISLDQAVVQGGTINVSASSLIDLNQYADNIIKVRDAISQLDLTQTATGEKVLAAHSYLTLTQEARLDQLPASAENQLDLIQTARFEPLPQSVESQIELTQYARVNIKSLSASSHIDLSQDPSVQKPIRVSATDELTVKDWVTDDETGETTLEDVGLRHEAEVTHIGGQSVEHILSFHQEVGLIHVKASGTSLSASSTLSLTQSAIVSLTADATSTLVLTQSAVGKASRQADTQLDLTHEASVNVVQGFVATTTIDLNQAATYYLITASTPHQYSPFVGESTDPNAPTPPPETLTGPLAGIQVPFQLVYPATGAVTDSVSLKAPNLGNQDRLAFNRINRETRGGTLIIHADPIWPKTETLILTFSGLLRVEAQNLLTFIDDHLGLEVGMIDWEHRFWKGIITAPDGPMVEDRFDSHTVSFEFQGELDPTWSPQVVPPDLRYSAIRSEQGGGYYVPCEPILPTTPEALSLEAEADSTIKIGNPIYIKANGHCDPAKADAWATAQVAGVSTSDANAGEICTYIPEGTAERSDWTEIAGSTLLTPGNTYFLSPTITGHITNTAPTTVGHSVVRVGRAVSDTKLDVEIELPILL